MKGAFLQPSVLSRYSLFAHYILTAFRAPSTFKGYANTSSVLVCYKPVCYTALTSPLAFTEKQNVEAVFAAAKLNVSVCSISDEAAWHQTPHCPYNHSLLAAQVHQPHRLLGMASDPFHLQSMAVV